MKQIFIIHLSCISQFFLSQENLQLKLYRENVEKSYFIYADNDEFAPISLEFSYTAKNMSSSLRNKSIIVIPAKSKKFIVTELEAINPKTGTNFNYTVFFVLGDVRTTSDSHNFPYSLPFAVNKNYYVAQGYNGTFSHQNKNSLDLNLKIGDEVFSARSGIVVQVVTHNNRNCTTKECAKFNNKIVILHDDGTFSEYVHLKQNGAVVKIGDQVALGQLIGYSGNTGWSEGPHLHFSVFTNKMDGERNYIKTKFKTDTSSKPIYLEEKKTVLKKFLIKSKSLK